MKIYILSSVRNASEEYKEKIASYAKSLEDAGHIVYLPQRDTKQDATGLDICMQNIFDGIATADQVHVFYRKGSEGSLFDMGAAFSFRKKIVVVENEPLTEGKSFQRMLVEWQEKWV